MGYSCSAKADKVREAMMTQLQVGYKKKVSNAWKSGKFEYFCEIGREHRDGAITGTVYKSTGENAPCYRVGSIRIEPNGKITQWATSTKAQRDAAETAGLIAFHSQYKSGWNDDEVLQAHIKGANFVVV